MSNKLWSDNELKVVKRVGVGFAAWFAFCALLGLTLLGTIGYVAYHFLSKVW